MKARNMSSSRPTNADIYGKVTANIVEALKKGVIPWAQPWHAGGDRLPCNALSRREYSGMNTWALFWEQIDKGYTSRGWVTFKQAVSNGMVPVKGSKGTPVFYMSKFDKKQTAEQKAKGDKAEKMFVARLYYVFNLDQLKNLDETNDRIGALREKVNPTVGRSWDADDMAEKVVAQTGAKITHGGGRACYIPTEDRICMPPRPSFKQGAKGYYPVLFHELGHWTGHTSRLDRKLVGRFENKEGYAMEELVAELTAAFLSARLGYDHVSQGASYLQSWLLALTEQETAFVSAARAAQDAADFIWAREEAEQDEDEAQADEARKTA